MLDAFISKKNILLLSYKKDFSQTFPHIHIMYLKSVHAHSLAIFLASQLFLSHNTFHCPSLHIKLKAILFILNQNQHDYIISSESAFFQQNNAPAIKPERYILSISNYLKLFCAIDFSFIIYQSPKFLFSNLNFLLFSTIFSLIKSKI